MTKGHGNMTKSMKATWRLRELMESKCIHSTADLVPKLAERGIALSRIQVYRLVAQEPARITLDVLAALCDILQCTPSDLIEVSAAKRVMRKAVGETKALGDRVRPLRTKIRRPD